MPLIHIGELVSFASNVGVMVNREALENSPEEVHQAIQTAYAHLQDQILVDACCGGQGPLADYANLSLDEYLKLLADERIMDAGRNSKTQHTQIRRKDYCAKRSQLFLAMLENHTPHVCTHPGCDEVNNLTIDHIVPLSRGGTDELSNLQFLCRRHNSAKGDSV